MHRDKLANAKALVRDRGSQFTNSFDEVFRTEGMKVLQTPVRTPVANSIAVDLPPLCGDAHRWGYGEFGTMRSSLRRAGPDAAVRVEGG